MLDIRMAAADRVVGNVEFCRIDLSPLQDGNVRVLLTATTVHETEPELLDQEIVCDRAATIDDIVALIRAHVRVSPISAIATKL
jgi:hypothetical protein